MCGWESPGRRRACPVANGQFLRTQSQGRIQRTGTPGSTKRIVGVAVTERAGAMTLLCLQ